LTILTNTSILLKVTTIWKKINILENRFELIMRDE
jgi:hypothetical protein